LRRYDRSKFELHMGNGYTYTLPIVTIDYYSYTCFYPRDAMLARVIVIATCPSVRPSVTRRLIGSRTWAFD